MRILAIDVGTGTQDIMIYDTEKELENSIKLVLPSPHLFISQQIRETENDIYFDGEFFACQTSRQKPWATEVLNTIQKEIKP